MAIGCKVTSSPGSYNAVGGCLKFNKGNRRICEGAGLGGRIVEERREGEGSLKLHLVLPLVSPGHSFCTGSLVQE